MLWLQIVLAATFLVFVPGLLEQFETPKAMLVRIAGGAMLVVAVLRGAPRYRPLDVAVLVWLAVELLATVASVSPRISLLGEPEQHEGLLTSLGFAGMYAGVRVLARDTRASERLTGAVLVAIAIASVYALLQAAGIDAFRWSRAALYTAGTSFVRPFGTLGHPNLLGVVTAAATVLALTFARFDPGRRWMLVPAAVLFGVTTVMTFSRGAWLAMVAGLAVSITLMLVDSGRARIPARTLAWTAAGAAATAALFLFGGWGGLFGERLADLVSVRGTTSTRIELWRSAFDAWLARPWLGHGPDTFMLLFPAYQTPGYWTLEWAGLAFHAHNVALHVLATRGVLGLIAAGACVIAGTHAAREAWRRGAASRTIAIAWGGAAVAVLTAGAFGALGAGGVLLLVVAGASMPSGAAEPDSVPPLHASDGLRPWRRVRVTVAVLLLAIVAAVCGVDLAASHASKSARNLMASEPVRAIADARRGTELAPYSDTHARILAETLIAASRFAAAGQPPDIAAGWVDEAEAAARRAVALEPERALNHDRLAAALMTRGFRGDASAIAEAESVYATGVSLAPWNALVMIEHAQFELALRRARALRVPAQLLIDRYPAEAAGHAFLACSDYMLGHRDAAFAGAERALAREWRGDDALRRRIERLLAGREASVTRPRAP